jgi:prefoldin subunit 5
MTIEELKKKRKKAHDMLQPIDEDGATYEDMYHAYNRAFDIVDEALEDAIKYIKDTNKTLDEAIELIDSSLGIVNKIIH